MNFKFVQVNCIEGEKPDLRQAVAILKHKPDAIFLEYPNNNKTPNTIYNNYKPQNKPLNLLQDQVESLEKHKREMPWVESDISMWKNIGKLWKGGHQVFVYRVDAPNKLVNEWFEAWKNMYPCAVKNWLWWVQIYLREKYMAKNVKWVLDKFNRDKKKRVTVLVFLQSFHWKHVKFLLDGPAKKKIWDYYFGRFSEISPEMTGEKIKKNNKVFYRYWNKISDFI